MGIQGWRDIALIFLLVQAIILSLAPLAIVVGVVYGLRKLLAALPPVFVKARALVAMIHMRAEQVSAIITAPILSAYALAARLDAWKRFIARELRR